MQKRSLTLKPLVTTNKVFRFIFFVSLIVFIGQNLSHGLQENALTRGITPISERTPQVRDAIAAAIGVDVGEISETDLRTVTNLNLRDKSITSLKAGDFSGLTALTNLNLHKNQLHNLPAGIFRGLTSLTTLRLAGNVVEPLPINVSLQNVASGQFKAVTPTGAPFDIVLPIVVTNGTITDGATQVVISQGNIESRVVTVSRPADMITAVTVDIGTLPECPPGYYGCTLSKSGTFPLEVLRTANTAPVFTEGPNTTRIVAENAVSGVNIGLALAVTDADNDELTFSLGGPDAAAFGIDNTTGQLTTYTELNYETKPIYTVTVTASDGSLTDTVTVTIHVNAVPKFREGEITTRVVMKDAPSGTSIGKPISAIDVDGDPLTYTLGGIDVNAFELDSKNYLKTRVPLDYDNRNVYCVTITASDGILTDTITVVTSVIGANDVFMFPEFVPVSERTPQVRDAIVDVLPNVQNAKDVTLAHLATITNLNLRNSGISELKSGDFSGMPALTNLNLHNNYLKVLPNGIFKDLTMLKTIRLGSNAVEKASVILYLKQVSEDEFKVVVPTGAPFDIILPVTVINGVITHGETPLVIRQGSMESETFGVACPLGRPITPTVVLNTLPKLPPGHYGYRLAQSTVHLRTPQVAEAITAAVSDITDPHYVTDIHLSAITTLKMNTKMITSLKARDFAGMLSLRTIFLQNNELTNLPYEIFDGLMSLAYLDLSGNEFTSLPAIPFDKLLSLRYLNLSGNRLTSLSENVFEGITDLEQLHLAGNPVDPLRLWVTLEKVRDAQFKAVVPAGAPFTIILPITVENGYMANDTGTVTIWTGETESEPFTVTRTTDTIDAVTVSIATFPKIPELHTGYFLARSDEAQLDPSSLEAIKVIESINVPPVFTEGDSALRTVAENTPAGVYIGSAIAATDANKDNVLIYTLGGPDADSFDIDEKTGQLKTKDPLDYETKPSYTVIITVDDGNGGSTSITVTINVPDVNEPPVFTEGSSTTRSIAENTESGVNIGNPIAATDPEYGTFTYNLGGTDANAFTIDPKTGQLQTKAALDYETKPRYSVTITADDGKGGSASINVTINIIDINEQSVNEDPIDEQPENSAPVFTDGSNTSRSIAENTNAGVNIGTPVAAKDADDDTLTYSLGGTDADAFNIDNTTGQLRTNAVLDYEKKHTYTTTITADDGKGGSTSIDVTISITDIDELLGNNTPVFTEGSSTSRSIAENTSSGADIGSAVSATDADGDTLTYSLSGTDVNAFSLDRSSGQLRTSAALDYETKATYNVTITADDGNGGSASIDVTINITNINEQPVNEEPINEQPENNAPVFTEGSSTSRSIAENTNAGVNIGTPVTATDADDDTLTYRLSGTGANAFSLDSSSGQLQTSATLDYETKSSYNVTITADDGKDSSASINVTINITNINEQPVNEEPINKQPVNSAPVFTEGSSTKRSIAENTASGVNIGSAVSATDADDDTLTYSLGGTNANAFSIDSKTGQLKTKAALDYETKSSYTITITATDGNGGNASIAVTINITDIEREIAPKKQNNAPVFTDGSSTTRAIAENTAANINVGSAVAATDPDDNTLTYSLSGTDADSFSIDSGTGQLKTKAALNYEAKSSYTITIIADDGKGSSASITVTVNVTNVNESPVFNAGYSTTLSVSIDASEGTKIGDPFTATDPDGDTIKYDFIGGGPTGKIVIDGSTGQLKRGSNWVKGVNVNVGDAISFRIIATANFQLAYPHYILVTVNVTGNEAPVFTEGSSTSRSIAENAESAVNIGEPVSATDADDDTLTYSLSGTDAASFGIDSGTGQLHTSATLDYETKSRYTVIVTADDGTGNSASITVTVNVTDVAESTSPVFTEGSSTTRTIAENTASGTNIGSPVSATDADGDTLKYSLYGPDVASFTIDRKTGQLKTKAALNFETKSTYTVKMIVEDDDENADYITVTVNVTNVNDNAPVFTEGDRTARRFPYSSSRPLGNIGGDIGAPISATDADGDTLTYSFPENFVTFIVNSETGQLMTLASFDLGITFTLTVSDGTFTDTIDVTINSTGTLPSEAPVFNDGSSTTRSVTENAAANTNVGSPITATDSENETLTYAISTEGLSVTEKVAIATAFYINSETGQLKTGKTFDYETKSSYSLTVTATNEIQKKVSIAVTINVTNVNEAPVFNDGSSTTRYIAMNSPAGTNIGSPVAATDPDGDTLTYSKSGTKAHLFNLDTKTGQLNASSQSFTSGDKITMTVTDGTFTDTIEVTIEVDVRPVFSEGSSTTRSVAKNAAVGTNVGSPITAAVPGNTASHTYEIIPTGNEIQRAFAPSTFSIDSTGQLKTKSLIYFNVGISYTFKVKASNSLGGTATIDVTVTVTAAASAPSSHQSPAKTALLANYPNPFNPETWIPYQLSKSAEVTLAIYNVKGEMVRQLALGHKAAGNYLSRSQAIYWDGKNQTGEKVSTGVYFYRFTAGDFSATRKMLIIK